MAKLRLSQWPATPGTSDEPTLLRPASIIEAIPGSDRWEWLLTDSREPFELSGGAGHEQIVAWHVRGTRVSTDQLVAELRRGEHQLNWGTMRGRRLGQTQDQITIGAFDSTWYDIDGPEDLVDGLAERFSWALTPAIR
jgi:hypothetical protein